MGTGWRHGRGTDGWQNNPHGPAGQRGEFGGGADEDGDILHGSNGPQVDQEQNSLQILIQGHISQCDGNLVFWKVP